MLRWLLPGIIGVGIVLARSLHRC